MDEDAYSVPIDVLQTISKNFEKLQADFEKSAPTSSASSANIINSSSASTTPTHIGKKACLKKYDQFSLSTS